MVEAERRIQVVVFSYAGLLLGVAAGALIGLEGQERWRVALGSTFLALQAVALWRLSWRFHRSALLLWTMTAGLICWIWGKMVWQLWGAAPLAAGLLAMALGATIGVTMVWVRSAWTQLAR